MPVFVIWALVFMVWTMSRTEPRVVIHKLSNWGLKTPGKTFEYGEMRNFWIESKWGSRLLRINLIESPWHMVLVINAENEPEIKSLLLNSVIYQEPTIAWVDKVIKWVGQKMPLE